MKKNEAWDSTLQFSQHRGCIHFMPPNTLHMIFLLHFPAYPCFPYYENNVLWFQEIITQTGWLICSSYRHTLAIVLNVELHLICICLGVQLRIYHIAIHLCASLHPHLLRSKMISLWVLSLISWILKGFPDPTNSTSPHPYQVPFYHHPACPALSPSAATTHISPSPFPRFTSSLMPLDFTLARVNSLFSKEGIKDVGKIHTGFYWMDIGKFATPI